MRTGSPFTKLFQQLQELDGARLSVGVQNEAGENFHGETVSSGDDLLTIAAVHEYGCDIQVTPKMRAWLHQNGIHLKKDTTQIHIPERSFIRRGYEEGKGSFNRAMEGLIGKLFRAEITTDELLSCLGRQAVTDTVGNMGVDTAPISAYTQAHRKQSAGSTPLHDTGRLANHITFVIKKGGGQ